MSGYARFQGCGGSGQRKVQRPKMSNCCSFLGWWWPEEGPTTENERLRSFSGVMGGHEAQRPKTSVTARFRGGARELHG